MNVLGSTGDFRREGRVWFQRAEGTPALNREEAGAGEKGADFFVDNCEVAVDKTLNWKQLGTRRKM